MRAVLATECRGRDGSTRHAAQEVNRGKNEENDCGLVLDRSAGRRRRFVEESSWQKRGRGGGRGTGTGGRAMGKAVRSVRCFAGEEQGEYCRTRQTIGRFVGDGEDRGRGTQVEEDDRRSFGDDVDFRVRRIRLVDDRCC